MKTNYKIKLLGLLLSSILMGCGGTDPLIMFDNSTPELDAIVQNITPSLNTPFTGTTPYWTFAAWGAVNYVAPASGVVSAQTADSVTIIHSGRLSTKITGLSTLLVRSGDYVVKGQLLGVFSNTAVQFQVLWDRNPVCPLSYMSQSFRQFFFAGVTGNPCPN